MNTTAARRLMRGLGIGYGAVAAWFALDLVLALAAVLGLLVNPYMIGVKHLLLGAVTVSLQSGGAALAAVGLWRGRRWGLGVAGIYNVGWAAAFGLYGGAVGLALGLVLLSVIILLPAFKHSTARPSGDAPRVW
ncbi:MAG: hypothetical protein OZ918_01080 [Nitrospirales bacterium]|nr:hypothetical protein [Nitrospira sp. NTP2]MCK6499297.1 hypothetical protein [Nitrospira sp.]MEB2337192.1 hypothetical protein [Nitrospirales bacterium]QOJ34445.1 MAG: hypothetical protein HRU82_05555 [Nitrospira sp.]RIK57537.1 MAG: hypothetical protein DCC63_13715 [Nitrospira sp.]